MRTGVIGASGYSGGELLRYLGNHPHLTLDYLAAGNSAGESVTSLHPHLMNFKGRAFEPLSIARANEMNLLFLALPHGESAKIAEQIDAKVKVVDLGADYRLESPKAWEKYYGGRHAGTWIYGLPELHGQRDGIAAASRIANPGCYATAIILATAPVASAEIIDLDDVTVVAASGTTGAGRGAKVNLLASEVMGGLTSYKFGGLHQHTPEIEEAIARVASMEPRISFTPILAPMARGILATITAKTTAKDLAEVQSLFQDYYKGEKFIEVLTDSLPKTTSVIGSNRAQIRVAVDRHTSRWIASIAIDNLGKGAAGQAIQNANLMLGYEEGLALDAVGLGS
jgi:N-acetyl-gamma-glutamyl-phosphate reductase